VITGHDEATPDRDNPRMRRALRIVLAQLNLHVGAIDANLAQCLQAVQQARDELGAHAIVFPELTLSSYPPEDLLLRPAFQQRIEGALATLAAASHGITLIVGHPARAGAVLRNAASVLRDGQCIACYHKQQLPNYGVFDERRYFEPGDLPCVFDLEGVPTAVTICEDLWVPGQAAQARAGGARLMLNLNGSPFHTDKPALRETVLAAAAREGDMPIVYVNLVGGQDELVFDGASMVLDRSGRRVLQAPCFEPALMLAEFIDAAPVPQPLPQAPPTEAMVYQALVLGVRDYVRKNRFPSVVLGLSGGVDSALTLAIAVDALGADSVLAVLLPSRYTADMSNEDALLQCGRMGVAHEVLSIEPAHAAFMHILAPVFGERPADITEENIQARCRGVLLMALSNKFGRLVLTTSNKSESAVGYSTLYGDMAGGFAPIKDCPKTLVYRLARWRNRELEVIPERVLVRPPSAELRPDQTDQDSLPPYDVLDAILERYVEQDRSPADIAAEGFPFETVLKVARLVDRNEYKRRQAAPGVRITTRAFGRDRRYPITSGYIEG
jgi:NAD+ synthase (glutamine-hydrolysing)